MKFSPKIDLTKFPTIIDQLLLIMWCSHIYRYSALHLHCDLVNSLYSLFCVIYWPRYCPFVYVVIVQYCIYCPIYRPILYLCFLGGNHPRNIYQKYGYHCRQVVWIQGDWPRLLSLTCRWGIPCLCSGKPLTAEVVSHCLISRRKKVWWGIKSAGPQEFEGNLRSGDTQPYR